MQGSDLKKLGVRVEINLLDSSDDSLPEGVGVAPADLPSLKV